MSEAVAWPEDLTLAFAAIGEAMNGTRLNPAVLLRVPAGVGAVVPGHELRLEHRSKGLAARYAILINGPRWVEAQWCFRSGELEQLARAAHANALAAKQTW